MENQLTNSTKVLTISIGQTDVQKILGTMIKDWLINVWKGEEVTGSKRVV